ncbi:MAG: Mov34/MPN/PAD-1 family protein [Candidatus Vogelbacteria bacterium]|nr:Mov34/MPN/PAD-1 family protein [Candidatus Vogelbacteria bacterium]
MIPIIVLSKGVEIPKEGTCYLITRHGVFLRKKNGLIEAIIPIHGIPFLETVQASARLHIPKIPALETARIVGLMQRVYRAYHTESVVLIHFNPQEQSFLVQCPPQTVTPASLGYDSQEQYQGFRLIGTAHSHGSMSAFHSGADDMDEKHFDGLHITFGNMGSEDFSVSSSIVVNGRRTQVVPEEVLEGITKVGRNEEDEVIKLRSQMSEFQEAQTLDFGDGEFFGLKDIFLGRSSHGSRKHSLWSLRNFFRKSEPRYRLLLDLDTEKEQELQDEWFKQVRLPDKPRRSWAWISR